jgi:HEAT repeat protein
MQRGGIICGALLFAGGLTLGFWTGRSPPEILSPTNMNGAGSRPPSWTELRSGVQALRALWSSGPDRERPEAGEGGAQRGDRGGNGWMSQRSREESFLALQNAVAAGDTWELRNALRDLGRSGGDLLSAEQIQELGGLLGSADRDTIRDLSRALAVAGGKEGLSLVMGFLEDAHQPLERRRQAIDGLADLPAERAADAIPALAEFLEKSPPSDLERSATNTIGRLAREKGVETLLGLLGAHPGIRAEAIFDAVGDVGGPDDSKALLSLLGGDWSAGAKMSLLRSSARLAARGADPAAFLGLLRDPPPGVPREMVAQALGDASRDLGTSVLRDALRETAGDRRAQEAIARALIWQGGKEGLDALLEANANPELKLDPRVLANALRDFQGEAAVPLMLDLFRSSHDEAILEPLARGIARNASKETMESFLGLLDSGGDAWQRRALARAIEDGGSAVLSADRMLALLHGEKDQEVASSLARAMSRQYPSALEGRAVDLFQNATSPVERVAFAMMLEKVAAPETAELLGRQLRGETDSKAQWEMARILGKIGEEGVSQVADALRNDADERHRHSLLWGLEASRRPVAPEARSLFVEMAGADPSPSIRAQAAEILGRQQDPALIPVLTGILGEEQHRDVRERIERAIRELEARK